MSNYNSSYKKHRSRKALSLEDARLRMTDGIKALEKIILESGDEYKIIQASNAMSGLISRYAKLIEIEDLEKRIKSLEEKFELRKVG